MKAQRRLPRQISGLITELIQAADDLGANAQYSDDDNIDQRNSVRLARKALTRAILRRLPKLHELRRTIKELQTWTPSWKPSQFSKRNDMYEKGDEEAPFFSEAYLYVLLGKDDARSLLGRMEPILELFEGEDR